MNILVFGWYGHNNIGDELFKDAFVKLFPQYTFIFTDHIDVKHLVGIDALFIGGGSLLDGAPDISSDALNILLSGKMPLMYIGVGAETSIHNTHIQLLQKACLVAIRSKEGFDKVRELCPNTFIIRDFVFALLPYIITTRIPRSILFLPNIAITPQWFDPHYKHTHFENFKLEVSQVLDTCIENGYRISFASLCTHAQMNDGWVAASITSAMQYRGDYIVEMPKDFAGITQLLSSYELIITQRYHGIVLSEITTTPYICIHHHDKLKFATPNNGLFTSYYGLNKDTLLNLIDQSKDIKFVQEPCSFGELTNAVFRILV